MQNNLFNFAGEELTETDEEINQELLEKGKALFPDRFFIFDKNSGEMIARTHE